MSRSNNTGRGGYAAPAQPQQPSVQPHPAAGQWRHPLDIEDPSQNVPPPHWPPQSHAPPHPDDHSAHAYPAQPHQAPYHGATDPYASQSAQAHHQEYAPQAFPSADAYQQPTLAQQDAYGRGGLATYAPQPAHDPGTYPQHSQWSPPQPLDQRAPDPRGYDLREYAPGMGAPAHAGSAEPAFSHDPYGRPVPRPLPPAGQHLPAHAYAQEPSFSAPNAYNDPRTQAPAALTYPATYPTSNVQAPMPAPVPYRQQPTGLGAQPHVQQDPQSQDSLEEVEFEDEEEEAPRRGRTLLIVGALVGAIFVGGGLAYTYRALSGGGKTPILSADKSAVKTKTNTPGQKIAEQAPRLPEVALKAVVASDADATGPRRVATIPVGPDGNTQAPPIPMAQPQTITMPGLAVTLPPPLPLREAQLPPQQQPPVRQPLAQPPTAQAPPVQPKVITPSSKQAALPDGPPPPPKKVVKPKDSDAFSPNGPATGGVTSTTPPAGSKSALGAGGNGYVAAILSTPKGKLEAMKSFADLQAKYPDVLAGKPAEVQEVNLGETKGVWYRAVVGPPGSRSGAAAVCEQLKAAGYTQCFATAY